MTTDSCQSFILKDIHVRGRFVRLDKASSEIVGKHDYPAPVARVLAELLAAGSALAGLLKYEGIFTLQSRTDGSINLSVVDVTHQGHLRGYAQYDEETLNDHTTFSQLVGKGYLAFTVDQGLTVDRYQGIVELKGESLCEGIEHYFDQSEQLESRVVIRSQETQGGEWESAALILQQMPKQEVEEESWAHIEALLGTINDRETFDKHLPAEEFLYRLFHELGLVMYKPQILQAQCRCSAERIKGIMANWSPQDIEDSLKEGVLIITCEFCNEQYTFKRDEVLKIH